eukprot:CAMPEP_0172785080 /NCGR_PEP_ID=MMETSP1074-20121228/205265_1 /TAXON_ID=2916 /ORGANISM="Ceratium fusus, Strain PA161109" /LENGTH=957 /DNA_ID=CAMNT_0013622085 /DNA_START=66 /DNA_END=2939 /DNA_ORIENTATION=+
MASPTAQNNTARIHGVATHHAATTARQPISPTGQVQPLSPLVSTTSAPNRVVSPRHVSPRKVTTEGPIVQQQRLGPTNAKVVPVPKDAGAAQSARSDGGCCLEILRVAELSVESLPATKRRLPLSFTSNDGGISASAVGRNHQPELFEIWLPNETLRNCISRTAFEIIINMRGESLGPVLMVRGSNPLKVNGRAVQQNVGVVLAHGSEIGFDYNPPGPQPFLLLSFQMHLSSSKSHRDQGLAKPAIPCQVPGTAGPAVSVASPAVDRHVSIARGSPSVKWHLACIHAEGKSAEVLAALPVELRQLEVPTGTLLLGRERQDRFFEALLAGARASEFSTFISRTHLELIVNSDADYMSVKNLSQNPVYVNKQPVAKGKLSALSHNQILSFARPDGSAGNIKHVHFLVLQLRAVGREYSSTLMSSAVDQVSETTPVVQRVAVEASQHLGVPASSASACASRSTPQSPVQAVCSPDLPKAELDRPEASPVAPPPPLGSPSLEPSPAGAPRPSILPVTALLGSRRGSHGSAAEPEPESQSPLNFPGGQLLPSIVANVGTCPPDGAHADAPVKEHYATAHQQETTGPLLELKSAPQDPPEEILQPQRVEQDADSSPLSLVQPKALEVLPEARPALEMTQITEPEPYNTPSAGARPSIPLDVTQLAEVVPCNAASATVTLELFGESVLDVLPAQRRIGPMSLLGTPLTVGRRHQPDLHKAAVREECLRFVSRDHFQISFDGSSFRLRVLTVNPIYRFRESADPLEVANGEEVELMSGDQIALGTGCDDVFDAVDDAHRRLCWHFSHNATEPRSQIECISPGEISPFDNEPSSPGGKGPRVSICPWSSQAQAGSGGYPAPPPLEALRAVGGGNDDQNWTDAMDSTQPRQERASDLWGPAPRDLGGHAPGAPNSSTALPRFGDNSPRLEPVLEESYPKFGGCNDYDSPDASREEYFKSLEITRTDF